MGFERSLYWHIISCGLYFFYPIFTSAAAYITDNLCTKNGNSSFFKPKICGLYTRAVTDQEQVIVARVRYLKYINGQNFFVLSKHAMEETLTVLS